MGAFLGPGNALGEPVPLAEAEGRIFGLCLVNDWSARDLQKWEYQPLGPFLAKSFATSVSPWVVTLEALAPYRVPAFARPEGDPRPLPYLAHEENEAHGGIDLRLEVLLSSKAMREKGLPPLTVSRSNLRDLYWTLAQMVAHHTSNGCNLRPGDLIASGTVSGPEKEARGCLLERTWRGTEPLALPSGEERRFLEDGDEVILRGHCAREGFARIGFGECRGSRMVTANGIGTADPSGPGQTGALGMTGRHLMAKVESLGIRRLESVHYYVHDLERSRRFYTEIMDFAEIGGSSEELTRAGRQKSLAFLAGNCVVVCIEPRGEGGRAWRWLRKHPDGVGTLNFEVEDVEKAFRLLEGRGRDADRRRPALRGRERERDRLLLDHDALRRHDVPLRRAARLRALYPGFEAYATARGGQNRLGFVGFDHTTSNFPTLGHVSLWLEHVMGFERFWEIQFHTADVDPKHQHGSGLRSLVYRDPVVGREVREQRALAPQLPRLADQRLQRGAAGARRPAPRDHGEGHRRLRPEAPAGAGARVHADPGNLLRRPSRSASGRLGIGAIDEDLAVLRDLEILVDGDGPGEVPAADLPEGVLGAVPRPRGGPFLLRDHPAEGRRGLRGRELPGPLRVDRAGPEGAAAGSDVGPGGANTAPPPGVCSSERASARVGGRLASECSPAMDDLAGLSPGPEPSLEARLVAAAREGDRTAFGRLYDRFAPMVHGLLLARVPRADVDDLVQEAFLQAMRRLGSLRDAEAFGPWLAAIARNRARDHWRRGEATVELSDDVPGAPHPEGEAMAVLAAIRRLPEAYRETLVLRLVEGMTGPEIAERTGLTPGSVRVNLHRGMQMLREALGRSDRP